MFIPYFGPSSEKNPDKQQVIRAVNAFNAAGASARRRRRNAQHETTGRSAGNAGTMHWFSANDLFGKTKRIQQEPDKEQETWGIEPGPRAGKGKGTTMTKYRPLMGPGLYTLEADKVIGAENALDTHQQSTKTSIEEYPDQSAESETEEDCLIPSSQGRNQRINAIEWPINNGFSYPIPKKSYYPSLLFQRGGSFLPVANQYHGTFAYQLHTQWNQAVLSDACLFHATLYATSSFMDLLQGRRDNPTTLYHKQNTIRLVQDAIVNSSSSGLSDAVITATVYLIYFAKINCNIKEGVKHDAGLDAMIRFRGSNPPKSNTITGWCLAHRHLWNSLFHHRDTLLPSHAIGPRHSIGSYTSLISIAIDKQLDRPPHLRLPLSVLEVIILLNKKCIRLPEPFEWPEFDFFTKASNGRYWPANRAQEAHDALWCCYTAASIYWRTITGACDKAEYQDDVLELRSAMAKFNTDFWFRFGPEVLRWILMTGAAAATHLSHKAWFIARSYMVSAMVKPEDMDGYFVGANHLIWVFNNQAP